MGRGATISQEELFETANRMEAEGQEVTALALHKALGRGSLTTVYKYMEVWKGGRPAAPPSQREMPDPVKNIFNTAWSAAMAEAGREVEAIKEKSAQEVREAQQQFKDALAAIENLESASEADAERIEGLAKQVAELTGAAGRLEAEAAVLRQQVASREEELSRLRSELERERKDKELAVKEAAEMKGRAETLTAQNDSLLKIVGGERK